MNRESIDSKPIRTVDHFVGSDRNIPYYGFNVVVFDYLCCGRPLGKPSRERVMEDAVSANPLVNDHENVDSSKIVLWGQSIVEQLAINSAVVPETNRNLLLG